MKCDRYEWARVVQQLFFFESVCDTAPAEAPVLDAHVCSECTPRVRFSSRQGLLQHLRIKHKIRNPARMYIDKDGICPGCRTNFRQRTRAIAHLSDARRPACMTRMLNGEFAKIGNAEYIDSLDADDNRRIREARTIGKNKPNAMGSAITQAGKRVGFATR